MRRPITYTAPTSRREGLRIYVEILIKTDIDRLWAFTQTPDLHARWDLRFSSIEYLPKKCEDDPQLFLYSTRIGFGLPISGRGESRGERGLPRGARVSALKFWSDDPRSLILEGSGFWRYEPTQEGIRFSTGYDYTPRYRALGRLFDKLIFRPLLGWATAWSFDRLRLWLERDLTPESAFRACAVHALSRIALSLMWIYHGIVPKLLFPEAELELLRATGLPAERSVVWTIAGFEILMGLLSLPFWRATWLLTAQILMLLALAVGAAITSPRVVVLPFNPVSLTICAVALALIAIVSAPDVPTARNCLRRESKR